MMKEIIPVISPELNIDNEKYFPHLIHHTFQSTRHNDLQI